jgi:signal transduction histidine kinase
MPRFVSAFLTAVIAGYWIGPVWAGLWLAAIVANERALGPFLIAKVITPNFETRPHLVEWTVIAMSVLGAALYAASWLGAWALGGHEFSFFAGMALSATLIHALTYLTRSPLAFAMGGAPALLGALWMVLTTDHGAPAWLMLLNVCQTVFIAVVAMRDRNALSQKVIDYRAEKKSAEQANRAKTNFLATMSHELRTPLNAVIGFAEILEEDLAAGHNAAPDDAARIARAGRSLLATINNVLDLSKIESGRVELAPEEADIRAVLGDIVAQAAHIAAANGNILELNVDPGMGPLIVDVQRLSQAALNLVSNACKFTRGGRVTVVATKRAGEEGATLSVAVIDTGPGIAEADLPRLFQPFVQLDDSATRANDGSGLGLVIARRLAQLMGGDVAVMSRVGRGSTFTLTVKAELPATEAARAAA